jgi:O-acetyl-ADP-ribose deacetylase (regulator of RNase III)
VRALRADITTLDVDAIVNAANVTLLGGGGVDGAIHRAAGPTVMMECARVGGCSTGSAVATGAGNLKARHVFHAVGPIWRGGQQGEEGLLASAYRRCLQLAEEKRCHSLAFPSISTGIYGYPVEKAAPVALREVVEHFGRAVELDRVVFVLFDGATLAAYETALRTLAAARQDLRLT